MRTKRWSVLRITLVIFAVAAAIVIAILFMTRNRYENDAMVVTWEKGIGKPLTVEGIVLCGGKPVVNQAVDVESSSGGNLVQTDKDGRFSINVSELELVALHIEGAGTIEWGLIAGLNLKDGASFKIQLK